MTNRKAAGDTDGTRIGAKVNLIMGSAPEGKSSNEDVMSYRRARAHVTRAFLREKGAVLADNAGFFEIAAQNYACAAAAFLEALSDRPDLAEVLLAKVSENMCREEAMKGSLLLGESDGRSPVGSPPPEVVAHQSAIAESTPVTTEVDSVSEGAHKSDESLAPEQQRALLKLTLGFNQAESAASADIAGCFKDAASHYDPAAAALSEAVVDMPESAAGLRSKVEENLSCRESMMAASFLGERKGAPYA